MLAGSASGTRARGVWEAHAGGTGVLALTGRDKAVALRGYVSGCVVEEAPLPLPQGEESADACVLQQWDNHLIQGEMRWPNPLTYLFPLWPWWSNRPRWSCMSLWRADSM